MINFNELSLLEAIKMFAPLLVIQLGLQIYCLISIFKNGVKNLNKWGWALIVLIANIMGCIVFLFAGRRRDYDDQD